MGSSSLDVPVCAYWPEFGQRGKEEILVRHLFEHRAPVVYVDADLQPGDVFDWDIMINAIEQTDLNWPITERPAYLSLTYGYLLGELFSRVNGRQRLAQFVRGAIEHTLRDRLALQTRRRRRCAHRNGVSRSTGPPTRCPPTRSQ